MRYREQSKRIKEAQAALKPLMQADGVPTLVEGMVKSAYASLDDALLEISDARNLALEEKKASEAPSAIVKPPTF